MYKDYSTFMLYQLYKEYKRGGMDTTAITKELDSRGAIYSR